MRVILMEIFGMLILLARRRYSVFVECERAREHFCQFAACAECRASKNVWKEGEKKKKIEREQINEKSIKIFKMEPSRCKNILNTKKKTSSLPAVDTTYYTNGKKLT